MEAPVGGDILLRGVQRLEIEAIVFDLDGTLYDMRRLRAMMFVRLLQAAYWHRSISLRRTIRILSAYRHALERMRMDRTAANEDVQIRVAAELCGQSEEEVQRCISRWFNTAPLGVLRNCMYPGVPEFLNRARQAGIRLGVLSDYAAEDKLRALGLRPCFDEVVSARDRDCGYLKPDPGGLLLILDRLGVEPRRSAYIGDIPKVDAAAAIRAGSQAFIIRRRTQPAQDWTGIRDYRQARLVFGL